MLASSKKDLQFSLSRSVLYDYFPFHERENISLKEWRREEKEKREKRRTKLQSQSGGFGGHGFGKELDVDGHGGAGVGGERGEEVSGGFAGFRVEW